GRILASTKGGTIHLRDTATGKVRSELSCDGQFAYGGLSFSPDGKQLLASCGTASGDSSRTIRVWDTATGTPVPRWDGRVGAGPALALAPDGRTFAVGDKHTIRLWEVATGQERGCFEGHRGFVTAVAISPDGRRLASSSFDTTALVWDLTGSQKR